MDAVAASAGHGLGHGVAEFVIDEVVEVVHRHPLLIKSGVNPNQFFLLIPAAHANGAPLPPAGTGILAPADGGLQTGEVLVPDGPEFLIEIEVMAVTHGKEEESGDRCRS